MSLLPPEAITSLLTLRYYRYRTDEETLPYKEWTNLQPRNISLDSAILGLNRLVDRRLSNLPNEVALLFSGGLDSSYLLSRLKGNTHISTITLAYRNKQPDTLREALDHFQPDATHIVNVDNVFRDLPKQIEIQGYPLWHLYSYYVMEKAAEFGMPIFTGDGGDEALAGYEFRYKSFMEHPTDTPRQRVNSYLMGHNRDWIPDQRHLFHSRVRFSWQYIRSLLTEYFLNPLTPLRQVLLADYHGKLRWDWVPMYRKWARHFNLSLVSPFLDPDIMQFGHSMPTNLLFYNNKGKLLLRESLKRSGAQPSIVEQAKEGFSLGTLETLWKNEGRQAFSSMFFEKPAGIVEDRIINAEWIAGFKERLDEFEQDPRYLSKAFQLIATEIWFRMVKGET